MNATHIVALRAHPWTGGEPTEPNRTLPLLNTEIDGTSIHVEVYIDSKTGRLVMAGQDIGRAPRQFFDRDEYEYFLSVPAEKKDDLLLSLMQHVFAGTENTRTAIAEWLDARGIPYELASF